MAAAAPQVFRRVVALAACAGFLVASAAEAAAIIHVGKKSYVVINAGTQDGVDVGDQVCFYDATATEVTCGKVFRAQHHIASVVVPVRKKRALTVGMAAASEKLRPSSKGAAATQTDIAAAAQDSERRMTDEKIETESEHLVHHNAIELGYLYSALLPFQYHVPAYSLTSEVAGSGALWRQDRKITAAPLGFELANYSPLFSELAIIPAIHARFLSPDSLNVDYDRADAATYETSKIALTSYGFSGDVAWGIPIEERMLLRLTVGLDVDQSRLKFTATRVASSGSTTVATLVSDLTALSLRLGTRYAYTVGPVAFGASAVALLPFAGKADTTVGNQTLNPQVTAAQAASANDDLQAAVGHKISRIGAQVSLSAAIAF